MRALALVALGAAVVFATGATGKVSAAPAQGPKAVKGELIVGFEQGVSRAEQNEILRAAGATSKKRFGQIDAVLVKVRDDEENVVTKVLSSEPQVAYVEPNHVVTIALAPNDPSFSQLWGLHNTGQTGGTNDKDIDAPEAWDLATGDSSIVVAVIDTGVDFSHPDLAAQQWINQDEIPDNLQDDDLNGYVDDREGYDFVNNDNDPVDDHDHGTHVSGTIGAVGDNGVGVVGVNWNVRIMALKFLSSAGSGSTADAMEATLYAADNGADVSSNSWGGGPYDQPLVDAIEYGASKGMLFVAAAGNDSQNNDVTPTYPGTYDSDAVLAVAATDHNDGMASFSSYGSKTVDLGAPGVNILSTTRNNTYKSFSGTSMATPHVAGAAALVEDHFSGATLYGIKALLMNSVDTTPALTGKTVSDGRLNVANALSCVNQPKLVLGAPVDGFVVGVGDVIPIRVLGANCAVPAGVANVTATVNGTPVNLSAATPDTGLYTATYTATVEQALTITAAVRVGGSTDTETASGNAYLSYTCQDAPFSWVDLSGGSALVGADGDDAFSTLAIGFPIPFFGQSYSTAYVSSNGFLTLGSNAGAIEFANAAIPTAAVPNGVIAPFWDDLNPGATGSVHAAAGGPVGSRVLYVEWFNVRHFLSGSASATFEVALHEATGEIRMQWLDTDLGDSRWSFGASATAGIERTDGVIGRQLAFKQPLLTNGKAVSCTYGTPPPPPPPSAPTIQTTTLPGGTVGQAYSQTMTATGGAPPYTWSLDSGSLPAGLALNSSTGAITGTPTSAGSSPFMAKVTDNAAQTDTQALSITVAPAPVPPPTITTTNLVGGTVGVAYSQMLTATDGTVPYAWSVAVGALPAGLTLNSSTGAIAGTPTNAGTFNFTARVTDAGTPSRSDTQDLSIAVDPAPVPPPTITTASLPGGTVGVAYNQTLVATGGTPPYGWSLSSGSLPAGLSLNPTNGAITGTPTSPGTATFTAQVTDAGAPARSDTQELSIAVVVAPLAIAATSLPSGIVGAAYSQTLTATGGVPPYTWTRVSGKLPNGLTLGSSGTISGTPSKRGTYTFTLRVTDTQGTQASRSFTVQINRP